MQRENVRTSGSLASNIKLFGLHELGHFDAFPIALLSLNAINDIDDSVYFMHAATDRRSLIAALIKFAALRRRQTERKSRELELWMQWVEMSSFNNVNVMKNVNNALE